jgi:hypothetical protein
MCSQADSLILSLPFSLPFSPSLASSLTSSLASFVSSSLSRILPLSLPGCEAPDGVVSRHERTKSLEGELYAVRSVQQVDAAE